MRFSNRMCSNWVNSTIRYNTFRNTSQTIVEHNTTVTQDTSSSETAAVCQRITYHSILPTSRPNSLRGVRFAALHETLLTLSTLPEEHPYYLGVAAATRASNYLGILANNLDIDPPRLFTEDGEAAVFTWDLGKVKRLLTVDAEEEDLMDIDRATMVRCDHTLPSDDDLRLGALLNELGSQHLNFAKSLSDTDA